MQSKDNFLNNFFNNFIIFEGIQPFPDNQASKVKTVLIMTWNYH